MDSVDGTSATLATHYPAKDRSSHLGLSAHIALSAASAAPCGHGVVGSLAV